MCVCLECTYIYIYTHYIYIMLGVHICMYVYLQVGTEIIEQSMTIILFI